MPYCINCGEKLVEGSKYCAGCGRQTVSFDNGYENKRRTVYDGAVHKCPNCGEMLKSMMLECPTCGYEIRGSKVAGSVSDFAKQLASAESNQKKVMIIRSFPIPNTKEDIFEFVLMASSNIDNNVDDDLTVAWQVKLEQAYQKANIQFNQDDMFYKIQEIYQQTQKKVAKNRNVANYNNFKSDIGTLMPVIPNLIFVIGWFISLFVMLPICSVNLDAAGTNGYQWITILDLIVGAVLVPLLLRNEYLLPRLITIVGLIIYVIFLILLCNKNLDAVGTNAYQLILVVHIICSAIILVRIFKFKINGTIKYTGMNFVILLCVLILFFVVYIVSSLVVSFNKGSQSDEQYLDYDYLEEKDYDKSFSWPTSGISSNIPKPTTDYGKIKTNSDSQFVVELYKVSSVQYEEYVSACVEYGFNVDSKKNDMTYKSYNGDGYRLELLYNNNQELKVTLEIPIAMTEIKWPSSGIVKSLPAPSKNTGNIVTDSTDSFTAYIGDISIDEYNDYIDKCIKAGFNVDYSRYDESFYAANKSGDDLTVLYMGYKTMYISVHNWN